MHEAYIFNSEEVAAGGQLDFHRSRVVAATLAELAALDPHVEFEGIVPNSMERGVLWQQYGQLCAAIGSQAVRNESRLYYPCQKDVAQAAGDYVASLVSEEQVKRSQDLFVVVPESPITTPLDRPTDTERITWRFRRQWLDISPSERHTPEVVGRLASELLLSSTLFQLKDERATMIHLYEQPVAV